ncbi:MAG: hypothetical protein LW832_07410 [Parachlamydia sp.]|jgi:hypothetical protein|nr:hypothetical protein [Parachlamydia sp.]
MFSYDLNLSQSQEILKNLYELHTLPETEKQVFFGSNAITFGSSSTTSEKVTNYMSTWYGWGTDLCYLPNLTERVVKFIQSEEGKTISQDEIMNAIEGTAVLLSLLKKDSVESTKVEEAMNHLRFALVSKEVKKEEVAPTPSYLSYFYTVGNYASQKIFGNRENTFLAQAKARLDDVIYFDVRENGEDLKNLIRGFFEDANLMAVTDIIVAGNPLTVPLQFYTDSHRINSLKVNGETIYDSSASFIPPEEICFQMSQKMPLPLFNKVGAIVHQSCFSDLIIKWYVEEWPREWRASDFPYLSVINGSEDLSFEIKTEGEQVEIIAKNVVSMGFANPEDADDRQMLGYTAIVRKLIFSKDELLNNTEVAVRSMRAQQISSHLLPSLSDALHFIESVK